MFAVFFSSTHVDLFLFWEWPNLLYYHVYSSYTCSQRKHTITSITSNLWSVLLGNAFPVCYSFLLRIWLFAFLNSWIFRFSCDVFKKIKITFNEVVVVIIQLRRCRVWARSATSWSRSTTRVSRSGSARSSSKVTPQKTCANHSSSSTVTASG